MISTSDFLFLQNAMLSYKGKMLFGGMPKNMDKIPSPVEGTVRWHIPLVMHARLRTFDLSDDEK